MSSESLTLENLIRAILPSNKYHDLQLFEETGGTREIYLATWGETGERKVIIKVDKKPSSSNGALHTQRGYTTAHEIAISSRIPIDEAFEHHLSPVIDYYQEGEMSISIEPYFEDSVSLRRYVQEHGSLNNKEFREIFSQVLEATRYLIKDKKLFHRDLSPSNILIRKTSQGLEARITDLANACAIEEVDEKPRPTVGAHIIADPFVSPFFNGGEITKYSELSEIYALGVDMLYALTGRIPFEFDIDTGEFKQAHAEVRPVVQDGQIHKINYNRTLIDATENIFWSMREMRDVVHSMMTVPSERIKSIDEVIKRFSRATAPSLLEKRWFQLTAGAAILLGLAGAFGYKVVHTPEEKDKTAQTYPVEAKWDGGTLEIKNNIVELDVGLGHNTNLLGEHYPEKPFLRVNASEKMDALIRLNDLVVPDNPGFSKPYEGQYYVEGFSPEKFVIDSGTFDTGIRGRSEGMTGYNYITFLLPPELKEGTYFLAFEIFSPPDNIHQQVYYKNLGKILSRKRIPLVVGNPKNKVKVRDIDLYPTEESITICDVEEKPYHLVDVSRDLKSSIVIPENRFEELNVGWNNASNAQWGKLWLPPGEFAQEKTICAFTRDGIKIIGTTCIPIEWRRLNDSYSRWDYRIPGKEFSQQLVTYREGIYEKFTSSK